MPHAGAPLTPRRPKSDGRSRLNGPRGPGAFTLESV